MIYLIRHGEDDEAYIGGWSKAELTQNGIEQIKQTTDFLYKNKIKFQKIYTSDIARAFQTATIINKSFNKELISTPILRELDKGLLTGLKKEEAKQKYPHLFKSIDINTKYPNGESMQDLYDRIALSLNKIMKMDNSLIVTHRGVINMIYYILNEIPLDMDKEKFNVTHGSIHQLSKQKIKRIY